MLLTMRTKAFDDERCIFEPKWDVWRILLHKHGDRMEAFTRSGRCVTYKFPELREAAEAIHVPSTILDCEGVCIRDGRSVFDDFQHRGRLTDPHRIAKAASEYPATFVAFDVLFTGHDHTAEPLTERKQRMDGKCRPTTNAKCGSVIYPRMTVSMVRQFLIYTG